MRTQLQSHTRKACGQSQAIHVACMSREATTCCLQPACAGSGLLSGGSWQLLRKEMLRWHLTSLGPLAVPELKIAPGQEICGGSVRAESLALGSLCTCRLPLKCLTGLRHALAGCKSSPLVIVSAQKHKCALLSKLPFNEHLCFLPKLDHPILLE